MKLLSLLLLALPLFAETDLGVLSRRRAIVLEGLPGAAYHLTVQSVGRSNTVALILATNVLQLSDLSAVPDGLARMTVVQQIDSEVSPPSAFRLIILRQSLRPPGARTVAVAPPPPKAEPELPPLPAELAERLRRLRRLSEMAAQTPPIPGGTNVSYAERQIDFYRSNPRRRAD